MWIEKESEYAQLAEILSDFAYLYVPNEYYVKRHERLNFCAPHSIHQDPYPQLVLGPSRDIR
jgi:hypothetical protein